MAQEIPANENPAQKKERLNRELNECEKSLLEEPENPDLLFQKGFIYNQMGLYEGAIEYLEKSIQIAPTVKKYQQLGLAYCEIEDFENSLDAYDKALELEPNNHETHNFKGFVYQVSGDLIAAISEYRIAISIDENYTDALLNLGFVQDEIGYHDEAIQLYDKIIAINPRDCCAYLNKGVSLLSHGKYHKAIDEFEKSIHLRNDDSVSHFNKGFAHFCCREYFDALSEFDIALSLDKGYVEAYYYKGLIFDAMDKKKEAFNQYCEAIKNGYRKKSDFKKHSEISKLIQLYQKTISDYEEGVSTAISIDTLNYHLAECYYNDKQYSKAINTLKEVKPTHQSSERNLMVDLMLADSYYAIEEYNEAVLGYNRIINEMKSNHSENDCCKYNFKSLNDIDEFRTKVIKKFYNAVDNLPEVRSSSVWGYSEPEIIFSRARLNKALRKNHYPFIFGVEQYPNISNSALIELNRRLVEYLMKVFEDALQKQKMEIERSSADGLDIDVNLTREVVYRAFKKWEINQQ